MSRMSVNVVLTRVVGKTYTLTYDEHCGVFK